MAHYKLKDVKHNWILADFFDDSEESAREYAEDFLTEEIDPNAKIDGVNYSLITA